MPRILPTAAVALVLALAPTAAWGAKSGSGSSSGNGSGKIVAPGDPGSTQYQEDVPTAAGSRPVTTLHSPSGKSPAATVLPTTVVHKLDAAGTSGRQTAALAQELAPTAPAHHRHRATLLVVHPAATATLLTSALLGSGGGVGPLLPIVLGVSLLVALALTLRRWRRP
jgi:hypothetical protein